MTRQCVICEGYLDVEKFNTTTSEICTVCQEKIVRVIDVSYAIPERKTKLVSYLSLISAVRKCAETDGCISDFEAFWHQTNPWPVIWELLGNMDRTDIHDMRGKI